MRKSAGQFRKKCYSDEVFIVDSFPIPVCDFKRAPAWTSPLKCADGTSTLATYGKCATKDLTLCLIKSISLLGVLMPKEDFFLECMKHIDFISNIDGIDSAICICIVRNGNLQHS